MAMDTDLQVHVFRGHDVPSPGMRESCGGKALLGLLHCLTVLIPWVEQSREFIILGLLLMPHQSLESLAGPSGDSLHNLGIVVPQDKAQAPSSSTHLSEHPSSSKPRPNPKEDPWHPAFPSYTYPKVQPMFALGNDC